ncbi:Thylakoid lumenal 16.5 kDa protein [Thalictrum thalictroides]|uniref:Thylakoid lumenal 16.5 kDa protein n=1 Tax=Thalictrum thalictroides TaxID=46969 RepID=A0A7J6WC57_THATH|nr:Thylakoid lumenal 16.5 kDa protein [Thalictrum thalictroides]
MAKSLLSTAKTILPLTSSSPSPCPSSSPNTCIKSNSSIITQCKAISESLRLSSPIITKRNLTINLTTILTLSLADKGFFDAEAAILEAEDDLELLERVKKDKQKRIERQELVSASPTETAYLQELVYKLGKVGQAIKDNKLSVASSVLGSTTNADYIKQVNRAFTKLSSSPEEKTEVDTFNSALASLITSVSQRDIKSSKIAFVSSVVSFEKWTTSAGLVGQLQGL